MKYTWATRSDVGQVRQQNEDSVLPSAGGDGTGGHLVAAIADGMGGAAGGEIASATAIATVAAVSGEVAIRIEAANLAVVEAALQRPRLKGMGTTMTMGIFHEDGHLQIGHVGDSRGYLLRAGLLTQVTTDHSFVNEMLASGRMTEAEAEVHPYRSVLTRVVGLEPGVEVEVLNQVLAHQCQQLHELAMDRGGLERFDEGGRQSDGDAVLHPQAPEAAGRELDVAPRLDGVAQPRFGLRLRALAVDEGVAVDVAAAEPFLRRDLPHPAR